MKWEELSGDMGLFIPNSPSYDLSVACKFMMALVAGAGFEPPAPGHKVPVDLPTPFGYS
jgi:hypothetical protein